MGCCLSTDEAAGADGGGGGGYDSRRRIGRWGDDKGGSFASAEEETVKEVLSETPARPACFVSRDNAYAKTRGMDAASGTDEVSDAGSLCENNVVEGRESSEYFYRNRMPAVKWEKSKSFNGEMGRQSTGRRSPGVKSSEPSPVRRRRNDGSGAGGGGMRSSERRDSPQKAAWGRPEAGERSGRRSRSPGMRAEALVSRSGSGRAGRSPSGRKTPNRGRSTAEGSRRVEEAGGGGEGKRAPADESLENPLVALECFIFL